MSSVIGGAYALGVVGLTSFVFALTLGRKEGSIRLEVEERLERHSPQLFPDSLDISSAQDHVTGLPVNEEQFWMKVRYFSLSQ